MTIDMEKITKIKYKLVIKETCQMGSCYRWLMELDRQLKSEKFCIVSQTNHVNN